MILIFSLILVLVFGSSSGFCFGSGCGSALLVLVLFFGSGSGSCFGSGPDPGSGSVRAAGM